MAPKKRTAQAAVVQDEGSKRKQQRGGAQPAPAKKVSGKGKAKEAEANVEIPAMEQVMQALLRAQDISSRTRCKLVSGLPGCFAASESHSARSPEQQELLQVAWTALQGVEAKLLSKLNSAKTKADQAAKQLAGSEEAKTQAQEAVNENTEALTTTRENLLRCQEAIGTAQQELTTAEAEIRAGDFEIGSKAMEREQLIAAGHGQDPAYADHLAQISQAISSSALARAGRTALADKARVALAEADEALKRSNQAVEDGSQRQKDCEAEAKRLAKVSKTHNLAAAKSQKAVDQHAQNLADFRSGPLAALRELGAFQPEPQETAESPAQQPEQQENKRPAEESEEPQIRLVRRRRCSWLPRHLLAARVDEVADDGNRRRASLAPAEEVPAASPKALTEENKMVRGAHARSEAALELAFPKDELPRGAQATVAEPAGDAPMEAPAEEPAAEEKVEEAEMPAAEQQPKAAEAHVEEAAEEEHQEAQPPAEEQQPTKVEPAEQEAEPPVVEQQSAVEEAADEEAQLPAAEQQPMAEEAAEEQVHTPAVEQLPAMEEEATEREVHPADSEQLPAVEKAAEEEVLPLAVEQLPAEEGAAEEEMMLGKAQPPAAEEQPAEEDLKAEDATEEVHPAAVEQLPAEEGAAEEEMMLGKALPPAAEEQPAEEDLKAEDAMEEAQLPPADQETAAEGSKAEAEDVMQVEQDAAEEPAAQTLIEEAPLSVPVKHEETPVEDTEEAAHDEPQTSPPCSPEARSPDGLKEAACKEMMAELSETELRSLPTPGRRASLA